MLSMIVTIAVGLVICFLGITNMRGNLSSLHSYHRKRVKKEDEIPLSARIMSIADVFDAVSQKRCYRDAMPLDECFEIIQKGKGWDFDPLLVDIFLSIRPQVEQIYKKIYG